MDEALGPPITVSFKDNAVFCDYCVRRLLDAAPRPGTLWVGFSDERVSRFCGQHCFRAFFGLHFSEP